MACAMILSRHPVDSSFRIESQNGGVDSEPLQIAACHGVSQGLWSLCIVSVVSSREEDSAIDLY